MNRKAVLPSLIYLILFPLLGASATVYSQSDDDALAVLVPGGGTYSRSIDSNSALAQTFFDQGLRMAWGFYFPESIASYQ